MRARFVGAAVASVGVASAAILAALGGTAAAGHLNTVASANLNGKNEVGTKGDRNGRGTVTIFGIDGDPNTLCYVLEVEKIKLSKTGLAGHIHVGSKKKNGDVVVNLAGPTGGQSADCLTEGEMVGPTEDVPAFPVVDGKAVTVAEILDAPDDFYVNVHNKQHPDGAIRGQLKQNDDD